METENKKGQLERVSEEEEKERKARERAERKSSHHK